MDSTGLNALRDVVNRFRRAGTRVILSDVHAQPMVALQRSALSEEIPEEDLVGNIDDALNLARTEIGLALEARPEFAVPTVAREERREEPRPPG
jgi:SulP family sulfate permease